MFCPFFSYADARGAGGLEDPRKACIIYFVVCHFTLCECLLGWVSRGEMRGKYGLPEAPCSGALRVGDSGRRGVLRLIRAWQDIGDIALEARLQCLTPHPTPGPLTADLLVHCCCHPCAMAQELRHYKSLGLIDKCRWAGHNPAAAPLPAAMAPPPQQKMI